MHNKYLVEIKPSFLFHDSRRQTTLEYIPNALLNYAPAHTIPLYKVNKKSTPYEKDQQMAKMHA